MKKLRKGDEIVGDNVEGIICFTRGGKKCPTPPSNTVVSYLDPGPNKRYQGTLVYAKHPKTAEMKLLVYQPDDEDEVGNLLCGFPFETFLGGQELIIVSLP